MPTRRKFIQMTAVGATFIACNNTADNAVAKINKPIVISTWESGMGVNKATWEILSQKSGSALDAVEAGAVSIENDIVCCVGLGGNPDREGKVTLDACIMDHQFNCGAVAFLERIKNPISVARKVMEKTPHVFLVGEGAQQFALEQGFALENGKLSEDAKHEYDKWLETSSYQPKINIEHQQSKSSIVAPPQKLDTGDSTHDTMGIIALDNMGNLSGACTTSGMAFKMRGRVGDSPIIGSGLFVDNEVGAVVATGQGEEVIRISGASYIVAQMSAGMSPTEACKKAIERIIAINPEKAKKFQVAFIALDKFGNYGAYSVNPEFTYCVHDNDIEKMFDCESHFKKS